MSKVADKPASGQPPRVSAVKNLAPALVLLAAGLGLLGYRVWTTLRKPPAGPALLLRDDAPIPNPPPPPADDSQRLHARISSLAMRTSLIYDRATPVQMLLGVARESGIVGNHLLAREALQAALVASGPDDPVILDALGRTEVQLGRFEAAREIYQHIRKLLPQDARGPIGESRALAGMGRTAEGVGLLRQAAEALGPQDAEGRLALSSEFQELGDLPRALELITSAHRIALDHPVITYAHARILYNLQRLDESRSLLEPLVSERPNETRARVLLAAIANSPLNPNRNPDQAERYLLEAIERDPDSVEPLKKLGDLCLERDRYRQAATLFSRVLEATPTSAEARMKLATALQNLRDPHAAAQREMARKLSEQDRVEEKLALARNRHPRNASIRLALAKACEQHGRLFRAFAELQAAYAVSDGGEAARKAMREFYRRIDSPVPAYAGGDAR